MTETDQLDVIRARHYAATSEQWHMERRGALWLRKKYPEMVFDIKRSKTVFVIDDNVVRVIATDVYSDEDLDFITHAHQDVKYLIDCVDELQKENQQLQKELSWLNRHPE